MTKFQWLATVGLVGLGLTAAASPALAAGTAAGSSITNNVTVNYQVGGIAQTATSATNTFTVDRKINVTVAEVGTTTTTTYANPGVAYVPSPVPSYSATTVVTQKPCNSWDVPRPGVTTACPY